MRDGEGEGRPGADPAGPGGATDAERARQARRIGRALQAGGIVFLAVVSLGLLPRVLSAAWPSIGEERAAMVAWVAAPALTIALLVVAALRLRR